ncbi:MAG: Ig-like domain-containing protein [Lachnospiraceae bacterium]|nr:Ig-like domain-containing protein [Lachnospiraceae bacterium]
MTAADSETADGAAEMTGETLGAGESEATDEDDSANAAESAATENISDIQLADTAEIAADEIEEDAASESVGMDEEPGVSVEEPEADVSEAAAENSAETGTAGNAGKEAETEAAANAGMDTEAQTEASAEEGASAVSLEEVATEEEPYITYSPASMVTDYKLLLGSQDTVTFEVALGEYSGTLSYQWYDGDGEAFAGETGSTFTATVPTSVGDWEYYCRVTASNAAGDSTSVDIWFYVSVTEDMVLNYTTRDSVTPGDSITLSVDAQSLNSPIRYQWYDGDSDEAIAGATSSTLEVTNVTSYRHYYCIVTDGVSTDTAEFYVSIDSGLDVYYADGVSYSNTIAPGESVTLSVSAATNYGSLTYQWYQYQVNSGTSVAISGATSASYRVSEGGQYYCIVSDAYDTDTVDFYVVVNSGLEVEYQGQGKGVLIRPGSSTTLSVTATSDYSPITYQWYLYQDGIGYVAINGATSASLTVSEVGTYYCQVSDGCSTILKYFYVSTDSGLSVYYNSTVYAIEGDSAVLTVNATVDYGSLSYEWYYSDSRGNRTELEGSSNTIEIANPSDKYDYCCCMTDDYGNSYNAWFYVEFVDSLSVSYSEDDFVTKPGESVTLSVQAVSPDGTVTYQWYILDDAEGGYVKIPGATSATLTVTPSTNAEYECEVRAGTSRKSAFFRVYIDTGLSVSSDQTGYMVLAGDSVSLSVSATTDYGTLSYSWYYYNDDEEKVVVGNAASLTLSAPKTGYYYCLVSDGIMDRKITFNIVVVSEIGETAESFSEAKNLTVGTSQTATIANGGAYMYYKIVPTESGTYTFYTSGGEDTYGCLYDADQELLAEDDGNGDGKNFMITCRLTAGATYYLGVGYSSPNNVGTFDVYMTFGESTCSHASATHTAAKAATCTAAGNIEYWYCADCGKYFSDAALTTEVSAGSLTIAATGHKSVTHTAAKAATCAATGNIEYWYCADCGKYFSNSALTAEVSAGSLTTAKLTTHTYGAWTTTTAATALATGSQTRTCSVCGQTETQTIAKLTPTITVNATSIKLKKKQSTTALKVSGLATGDSVASWKSSNTKIVTVTSKGKITAKSKTGTAYITITLKSGLTKKVKVTVQKSAVKTTKITVPSKTVSIKKGKTYTIKPVISPITSVQKVTYSSSNKKVATVNSKGKITAKKKGTATITVKSGSKSVKIKVTVK